MHSYMAYCRYCILYTYTCIMYKIQSTCSHIYSLLKSKCRIMALLPLLPLLFHSLFKLQSGATFPHQINSMNDKSQSIPFNLVTHKWPMLFATTARYICRMVTFSENRIHNNILDDINACLKIYNFSILVKME